MQTLAVFLLLAGGCFAATDTRVNFTLETTDDSGAPVKQHRLYFLYRPDNLPKTTSVPMIIFMSGSSALFHRKADQAGFVVVGASFSGNSSGTPGSGWTAGDPRTAGLEDYDYITEVIKRVKSSDNCNDVFTVGLSKGGHMSLAYACVRPSMIKAASSLDEFMGLTTNIPAAPLPIIVFHGTMDMAVPYTMAKDTVDAWRALDGLQTATPVTTYEASPLLPGNVSQTTWRSGTDRHQVAFVTIVGGTHEYPIPNVRTGYDFTDGLWAFFSQFLTDSQGAPKIVSRPVDNVQLAGQPASFWVAATGAAPLHFQWQKNGVDIPGATSNWLTTLAENGAAFRAVVSNASGSIASSPATLTVNAAPAGPTITAQPANKQVVAGQPVTFTVDAHGATPLKYQWQKNGMDIVGATAASLAIPAAITADCGATFAVVVTDGTGAVASNRATLTVSPAPQAPVVLVNPERARVTVQQKAAFSVTAKSASRMNYQWQKGPFTGNMADIPGATAAKYTTPPVTLSDGRMLYRCVVSNATGSVTSASEMLLVRP